MISEHFEARLALRSLFVNNSVDGALVLKRREAIRTMHMDE